MLVGGLEHEFSDFPYIGDKSSSQLTNSSFFRGVGGSTTNQWVPGVSFDPPWQCQVYVVHEDFFRQWQRSSWAYEGRCRICNSDRHGAGAKNCPKGRQVEWLYVQSRFGYLWYETPPFHGAKSVVSSPTSTTVSGACSRASFPDQCPMRSHWNPVFSNNSSPSLQYRNYVQDMNIVGYIKLYPPSNYN